MLVMLHRSTGINMSNSVFNCVSCVLLYSASDRRSPVDRLRISPPAVLRGRPFCQPTAAHTSFMRSNSLNRGLLVSEPSDVGRGGCETGERGEAVDLLARSPERISASTDTARSLFGKIDLVSVITSPTPTDDAVASSDDTVVSTSTIKSDPDCDSGVLDRLNTAETLAPFHASAEDFSEASESQAAGCSGLQEHPGGCSRIVSGGLPSTKRAVGAEESSRPRDSTIVEGFPKTEACAHGASVQERDVVIASVAVMVGCTSQRGVAACVFLRACSRQLAPLNR